MATARKLPSGSWRCLVYSHKDPSGKRIYKSFTYDDPSPKGKRICEQMASEWAAGKELNNSSLTFKDAANEYIASRTAVCSPRTIEEYTAYIDRYLSGIVRIRIDRITQADIQKLVNQISIGRSPKTVRNVYGFVIAVIDAYRDNFVCRIKLPQKTETSLHVPTDADIKQIIAKAEGTSLELPILLAAFGPMRRGEICALRAENIDGNVVHVCENMVRKKVNGKKTWVIKSPKSTAGNRYIEYPDFVAEKWRGKTEGRLVEICPDTITKSFGILLKSLHIEHFRFHDIRHYSASILHAISVPDVYIQARAGWSSDRTLKNIYRHPLDDKAKAQNQKINQYFTNMHHEMQHEKEKTQ